jgi:hypothetical protein
MQTERHSFLDERRHWSQDPVAPFFDAADFQARINRRVGLSRDGKPILRLVWAPAVETHSLGERVRRYWVTRERQPDGSFSYVSPPRWVIEKRLEREAYWAAHEATRWQTDALGNLVDMGPPPEDYYVFEYLIAEHDGFTDESGEPQCCAEAWKGETKYKFNARLELVSYQAHARSRCWGRYREPNHHDLKLIERAVREMNADRYYSPYAPMSAEQLAVVEANANLDAYKTIQEADTLEQQISDDFAHSYGWRLLERDAGRLSSGRYHFLGNNWKAGKSGLTVPVP